jgi:hypothetical protein
VQSYTTHDGRFANPIGDIVDLNSGIHVYFAAAEALHIVTTRQTPFQSLAAEYTPLNDDYTSTSRDDIEDMPVNVGDGYARPT